MSKTLISSPWKEPNKKMLYVFANGYVLPFQVFFMIEEITSVSPPYRKTHCFLVGHFGFFFTHTKKDKL